MDQTRARTRNVGILAATAVLLALVPAVSATTMVPLSLDSMTAIADDVVLGRVLYSFSYWNEDRSAIVTETHIAVDRYLKAVEPVQSAQPYVTVRQPGGMVGSYGMRTAAAGTFDDNEWVLVFLKQSQEGRYQLVGLGQGKFSIVQNSAGEQTVVGSSKAINSVLGSATTAPATAVAPAAEETGTGSIGLESFERRVRGLVAVQKAMERSPRGKAKGLK